MSNILLIRHAETDMAGTFCGHSDPELNDRGHAQLFTLIEALRGQTVDAVYTSDLRRARTTADAIAKEFHADCSIRPALQEISFGDWEGLTWHEVERRDPAYADRWLAAYPNLPAPSGESFSEFEKRVLDAVKSLTEEVIGGNIAIVSHGGVIRTVLRKLQGCSEERAWEQTREYCCIIRHSTATPSPMPVEVEGL